MEGEQTVTGDAQTPGPETQSTFTGTIAVDVDRVLMEGEQTVTGVAQTPGWAGASEPPPLPPQ